MKKWILVIGIFVVAVSAQAQTYVYQAEQFAYKEQNSCGYWNDWSDWQPSNVKIAINTDRKTIKIFSPSIQTYLITEHIENYIDKDNGRQSKFEVIDQDGDMGTIRLRIEQNGNSQLYVQFKNIIWVYSGLTRL